MVDSLDGSFGVSFAYAGEDFVVLAQPSVSNAPELGMLTSSERAVLEHVLEGHSDREIGLVRGVSPRTVAKQLASIYRKTGAGGRVALFRMFGRR